MPALNVFTRHFNKLTCISFEQMKEKSTGNVIDIPRTNLSIHIDGDVSTFSDASWEAWSEAGNTDVAQRVEGIIQMVTSGDEKLSDYFHKYCHQDGFLEFLRTQFMANALHKVLFIGSNPPSYSQIWKKERDGSILITQRADLPSQYMDTDTTEEYTTPDGDSIARIQLQLKISKNITTILRLYRKARGRQNGIRKKQISIVAKKRFAPYNAASRRLRAGRAFASKMGLMLAKFLKMKLYTPLKISIPRHPFMC